MPRLALGALRAPAVGPGEREGDVRVPDERHPGVRGVQAEVGEQRRQDVLPHGIARGRVEEADRAGRALGRERPQEPELLLAEHLLRPARGEGRAARELVERQLARSPPGRGCRPGRGRRAPGPARRRLPGLRRSRRCPRGTTARRSRGSARPRARPRRRAGCRGCRTGPRRAWVGRASGKPGAAGSAARIRREAGPRAGVRARGARSAAPLGKALDPLAGAPLGVVVLHGVDELAHEARGEVHAGHDDPGISSSSTSWSTRAKVTVNS
jgi:hypothetical protein